LEIEAKYTTSRFVFDKLLKVDALGEYRLEATEEQLMTDRYLDTGDRDIQKGGYAFRVREKNGRWLLTVKGLGTTESAIHRREEYEVEIQSDMTPQQWPDSPARDLVFSLTRSQPLIELFVIRQHRTLCKVFRGERLVGELSLDVVDMGSFGQQERTYEVEVELEPDGTLEDLQVLDGILQSNYDLRPETRSKFERALSQLEGGRDRSDC
jgi:inorganic triphosphatase YgiF